LFLVHPRKVIADAQRIGCQREGAEANLRVGTPATPGNDATGFAGGGVFFLEDKLMAEDDPDQQNQPPLEQAEFDINDANTEAAHRAICDAVNGLNGVREVQFVGGGVVVTFNPIGITKEEICTVIRRSGYRATEITSSPGDAG
jgi:hypothetical protein